MQNNSDLLRNELQRNKQSNSDLFRNKQTKQNEIKLHGNELQSSLRMITYMMSLIENKKDAELGERSKLRGSKIH
jgi:hypothetical protein